MSVHQRERDYVNDDNILNSGLTSSSKETSAYPKALASSHPSFDTDSTECTRYKYGMHILVYIPVHTLIPIVCMHAWVGLEMLLPCLRISPE